VSFADALGDHGDRVALVTGDSVITYADLAARVAYTARQLGPTRRLVQVTATTATDPIVAYLAALHGEHVVLLTDDDARRAADMTAAYDPDVVVHHGGRGWAIEERRSGSAHELHPDLALLMSTSGSTGAGKLVRLSTQNLNANAAAIAHYLDLRAGDRALTTLPLHYCYGLSVLNSHLAVGAGVVLSDRSVIDPCFWEAAHGHGVTGIAGVPHTFDLLERLDEGVTAVPTLRYVTQAGGRMPADQVRRIAERGERQGWDLYVMYGQTEATARMAYLPPSLAASHPQTIGIPIPGGSFELAPVDDDVHPDPEVGELVFRGPNVMLGYAEAPADLALGATVDALRTGDLARRTPEGLYEILGRRSRFVKPFGVRVDLDELERALARRGIPAVCTGDDGGIAVAVTTDDSAHRAARLLADLVGLPPLAIAVRDVPEVPRLPNGKPDHRAVLDLVRDGASRCGIDGGDPVRAAFAEVVQAPVDDDSTFVGLGGDSLSYVEMSMRLEGLLGHLPADWHRTPVRDLRAAMTPRPSGRTRQMETGVVIRAVAIGLIVGTHAEVFRLQGGAHVLLALAGLNFARFQLRSGHRLRSLLRVALPSVGWLAVLAAVSPAYDLRNVLLLNGYLGDAAWNPRWRYWFVEALVLILGAATLAFAVPAIRRLERRAAFVMPLAVMAAGLVARFDLVAGGEATRRDARPHTVLWLFALGWAIDRADTPARRAVVTLIGLGAVPGFFGDAGREALLAVGLLLLIWVPTVAVPRPLDRAIGLVAGGSLFIYLTHWQVYPPLLERGIAPIGAAAASLVVGLGAWWIVQRATTRVEGLAVRYG
jgi:acyl-CoA synthetase (AMP-forming)/AMP-acid ligase II